MNADDVALVTPDGTRSHAELAAMAAEVELPEGPYVPIVGGIDETAIVHVLAAIQRRRPMVLLHPRWTTAERERFLASIVVEPDDETFAIFATSGSSGRPKAVELTRDNFLAAAKASAARLGWQPDDRWQLTIPLAHVGGFSILIRCWCAHRPVVIGGEPGEGATIVSVVPTQLARIAARPPPPSLRLVLVGGAPLSPTLRRRADAWPVRTTYGMTEACAQVATQADPEDVGVGRVLDGTELRIDGEEILVRGPTLFRRYATGEPKPVDDDGWFRTGDLGRLDDGCLTVFGRADDLIITGGENVHPAEVEDALRAAGAKDAVVFAASDELWGETVVAAIEGEPPDPSRLDGRLAGFKRPKKIAQLDAFPRTPIGKVDRRTVARIALSSLVPWEFAKRAAE